MIRRELFLCPFSVPDRCFRLWWRSLVSLPVVAQQTQSGPQIVDRSAGEGGAIQQRDGVVLLFPARRDDLACRDVAAAS